MQVTASLITSKAKQNTPQATTMRLIVVHSGLSENNDAEQMIKRLLRLERGSERIFGYTTCVHPVWRRVLPRQKHRGQNVFPEDAVNSYAHCCTCTSAMEGKYSCR